MRIYIVEDDTSVIGILEDIVEGNELGVVCGDSGGEPVDLGQILALNPDLILVDLDALNLFPCHDVEEDLVYSARGSNVVMNMARGRVIYEKGEFFTLDLEKIRAEVESYALPRIFGSVRGGGA